MNREFIYTNTYNGLNYPTNQPPPPREQYYLHSPEAKRQSESQLIIFNGEQPVRDIYNTQETINKPNLAFIPQRVNKKPSQKAFPIIYNTYNDGGTTEPQIKLQNFGIQPSSKPIRYQPNEIESLNQNNHSSLSDKQYRLYQHHQQQASSQNNQFHTFQQLPPQSEPQTAKFLQNPDKSSYENYFMASQTEPYRPPPSPMHMDNRTFSPPLYNFQPSHPIPASIPHNQHDSRVVHRPSVPISPTNRVIFQEPQRFHPSFIEEKPKLITISQEEYQRFIDHQSQCRKIQEENNMARTKIEQLGQKEHFYWQENVTLREQNKRLRDLVAHFEKREKELVREREEQKQGFEEQIIKYRDSALEEFKLLIERYRLELQRNK